MSGLCFVYVTAPERETALAIGRAAVAERLAACANVLDSMTSVYWWEGALQEDSEAVLVLKTRAELVAALTARITALHPYDCPCVVSFAIGAGNPAYLDWLRAETAARAEPAGE